MIIFTHTRAHPPTPPESARTHLGGGCGACASDRQTGPKMANMKDTTKPAGQTWHLILRAEPDPIVPAYCRLRKFLKMALRSYGLRCTRVEEIPAPEFVRLGDVCRDVLADLAPSPRTDKSTPTPPATPTRCSGDNTPANPAEKRWTHEPLL